MSDNPKFWLVWNPQGRAPTHQHPDEIEANAEAKRLALANRGQKFFVMEGKRVFVVAEPVTVTELVDDELPF